MITIPHATEAIRMQAFQTHTAAQPISIQTQQKPSVTKVQHNAEKHSLLHVSVCPQGGICACQGVWVAGGHSWWMGACVAGLGMYDRGCVGGGGVAPSGRYHEIRSMSGRYASYWNAFLLKLFAVPSMLLQVTKLNSLFWDFM